MAQWYRIAKTSEIAPGTARELTAAGRIVALFNVGGTFYALDGICPHAGGPLGEGMLEGSVVTCPWHGWQFDVTTGRHVLNPYIAHATYPLEIKGEEIWVELP